MASLVDVDNVRPGYFWTSVFEEVLSYVQLYIEQYNEPFLFIIHASAVFIKDENETEIHMQPCNPVLLDPAIPMFEIMNIIGLCYDEMHDPEAWGGLDSSGYSIIMDTFTYWFKIIPHNPNNKPKDNDKNRKRPIDPDDPDDPEDPIDPDDPSPFIGDIPKYSSLLYAIAAHFIPNQSRRSIKKMIPLYTQWLEENNFYPDSYYAEKITPGNIAEWHEQTGRFFIRLFSEHGNIIYARDLSKEYIDGEECIDLLWKYKKFSYITNLWSLLRENYNKIFCNLCKKFHKSEDACKDIILSAPSDKIDIPEFPLGRHACVAYADFESIVQENDYHKCSGFSFVVIDKEGIIINNVVENALNVPNPEDVFIDLLTKAADNFAFGEEILGGGDLIAIGAGIVTSSILHHFSKKMKKEYKCPICDDLVGEFEEYVLGRNFINGERGRHHKECWYDFKNSLVCYFHNFRGYDSHYVLQSLMKENDYNCEFIRGKSFEKFDIISYTYNKIRITFKDTFNYLSTSIAKLITQVENWKYTPEIDRNDKGTFPYKWFSSLSLLSENQLPSNEHWYNDITQSYVDPTPAYELWNRENMNQFSQFHDYYMKTDVLQLADIFEEFRNTCLKSFNLDPVYFQGAPSYSWQLNLQLNAEKMYLIQDKEIYMDIQKNIRGGIAQVMHRYINLEDKPDESILFLDVNSLYSKCMTYKLPTKYIKTIYELPKNWEELYNYESNQTMIVCVDLAYPAYLHDSHLAYPLAPHKYNGRLCTTLHEKINYLCHINNLKFYIDEGLLITKFYYGYIFDQDYILKDYVDNNIIKRRTTNSLPLKTLYKLLNNSLYGKTCENKFKYRKFEVHEEERTPGGRINPFLSDATNWLPINDKVLVERKIHKITLDKPIQIGFSVLELAKLEMYKFLFDIQNVFDEYNIPIQPLYTDTDSIIIHFKCPNPQNLLFSSDITNKYLDFDKVPEHWVVHTPGTHKQSGLWSLETTDKIIEFVGIRAKTYCYRTDKKTVLKNKGVTATAVELHSKDKLTIDHYKDVIFGGKEIKVCQVTIGSKKHEIKTNKQVRLAITSVDEKRQILADKITSIPFGYKGEKYKDVLYFDPEFD